MSNLDGVRIYMGEASGWQDTTSNSTFVAPFTVHPLPLPVYLERLSDILLKEASLVMAEMDGEATG